MIRCSMSISPYIREGSGLKHFDDRRMLRDQNISPYIREGSGLKPQSRTQTFLASSSPLTSVRGAD